MKKFWKHFGRVWASIGALVLLALILCVGTIMILCFGPSVSARNLFVNSALESSVGKLVVPMVLGEEKLKEITSVNSVEQTTEVTDPDLIVIPTEKVDEDNSEQPVEPIEIIEISGTTYNGIVALVHDPSRLSVGVCGPFGPEHHGATVKEMADKAGAVLAINGGGFNDPGGVGNGGTPEGIVIQEGNLAWGELDKTYEVIGFNNDNKLVIGYMTGQQALDRGIKSALSFGPFLVVNSKPVQINGEGGGVNPRTAIGQRADGTVIMVAIDGRQPNSLGATMKDLINIMMDFGAVNAANLDGGSSTMMYYQGEYINHYTSLYGPRGIATCILVK